MALTNRVAIDCEMVGGISGENLAARVSLVNEHGQIILDKYIKPSQPVGDYRNFLSGISKSQLNSAETLWQVAAQVARIINGRILVGHSLYVDLNVLGLSHPEGMQRDLAQYPPFKSLNGGQPASLKFLANKLLGRTIQEGQHSSVEDAKASMDIYCSVAHQWQ